MLCSPHHSDVKFKQLETTIPVCLLPKHGELRFGTAVLHVIKLATQIMAKFDTIAVVSLACSHKKRVG